MRVVWSALILAVVLLRPVTVSWALVTGVMPSGGCESHRKSSKLDEALNNLHDNKTNVTLQLAAGTHCISTFNRILEDLNNVTIEGIGSVTVKCTEGLGLAVYNAIDLTIRNIEFEQCGANNHTILEFLTKVNETVDLFFTIRGVSENFITLLCGSCENFVLSDVTIKNTTGLGFLGINLIGESRFENATFSDNVAIGCYYISRHALEADRIGGGALLIYQDYRSLNSTPNDTVSMEIVGSSFLYNSYCSILYLTQFYLDYANNAVQQYVLNGGGGLSLKLAQLRYNVNFTVNSSVFRNNTARNGGGANIQVFTGVYNSYVEFVDCEFSRNGLDEDLTDKSDYLTQASSMAIVIDSFNPLAREMDYRAISNYIPISIRVSRTNFTDNRAFIAGGVSIFSLYSPGQRRLNRNYIQFDSCNFERNYAYSASALQVIEWKASAGQPGINVILNDVRVIKNTNFQLLTYNSGVLSSGAIHVVATNVTINGTSVIEDNVATGVYLTVATLHIDGNLLIRNNTSPLGGGIRIERQSLLIISNNTNVSFIGNTADLYGGAIYSNYITGSELLKVIDCPLYFGTLDVLCFSDFTETCTDITTLNINMTFRGNSATFGSMVFGTTFDTCPWARALKDDNSRDQNILDLLFENQENNLSTPIHFDTAPNMSQATATYPSRLDINASDYSNGSVRASPGHTVMLHISALDDFDRLAPTVLSSLNTRNGTAIMGKRHSSLGSTNYWLLEGEMDSDTLNVPLNVYGSPSAEPFNVTLITLTSYAQSNVLVHLLDCPVGFVYDNDSRSCVCDERFQLSFVEVKCNDDSTLSVPTDLWVGFGDDHNETLLITKCRFDYCKSGDKNTSQDDFSSQCREGFNRAGVGCGACKEGYSQVLGTNRCEICSNTHLLIILPLAILGVAIIAVLSILRVSVSNGYLNGLLFYSSVLTLFIPVLTAQAPVLYSILAFFSWLNLYFGFELCFYENMTALQRATFGFLFPLYLYALMVGIILVAKVSQKFADRFNRKGYSATKLFATLFVITYTNILANCITILGFQYVRDLDGQQYWVWSSDANQRYFQDGHIPLFLLAIFLLIVYLIPAPFILMFPSLVLRVKYLKNYKPLYDAFWAPFKPNFRFWIGLRLFLRIIPLIFSYFISNTSNVLLLSIFLLILVYVQAVVQPFEGKARNASDLFFLVNLVAVTMVYLYFYIFLYNSRVLDDSYLMRLDFDQTWCYSIIIGLAYFAVLVLLVVKIFKRYPILQYCGWVVLTKIFFCSFFAKWLPEKPSYEKINFKFAGNETKTYGTTTEVSTVREPTSTILEISYDNTDDDLPKERKAPVNFTELREPLLETSGSFEVQTRHTVH